MPWYHLALIAGYAGAGLIAWNVPRGTLWAASSILIMQASYMWWEAGLPHGAFVGGALNIAMCLALYALARQRWEMTLWRCYHLMIVLDILFLLGAATHFQFAIGLEIANMMAIAVIGATGLMERLGNGVPRAHPSGWLGSMRRSLYAKRRVPPWWQGAK